jgi:phosphate:Na+ symporter
MPLSMFEGALGGIGLFLLGMRLMSDGIRTVADSRIRRIFSLLTSNRLLSITSGIALSLAVNSGSAAIILTIGLINGGVLNSFQAINVIAGVLIGASLSLYITILPYSLIASLLVFSGVVLKFFARRRRFANAGDLLLGIGLLFLGLAFLENSFRPNDHHPLYETFHGAFFSVPSLAALFGALVSFLVQSARSTITIIASLVQNQHIGTAAFGSMVVGGLVGVAAIGSLASLGGNFVARRIAAFFLALTTAVSILYIFISPLISDSVRTFLSSVLVYDDRLVFGSLVLLHSVVSTLTALCAVVLSGPLSRLLASMEVNGNNGGTDSAQPCAGYLDVRIISTPPLAIEQARKEIIRMMSVASFMYADVREVLFNFDARRAETIRQHETVLDSLNHEITSFLALLSRSAANPGIQYEIPGFLQTVTALERIGDRCENILDGIITRKNAGIVFSDAAMDDLRGLTTAVADVVIVTEDIVRSGALLDPEALHRMKRATRSCFEQSKHAHFERISSGTCQPQAMLLFNDMSSACIRIAEECWNILGMRLGTKE